MNFFIKKWMPYIILSVLLLGAFILKVPCLTQPWGGESKIEYKFCCYNDMQPLYGLRHLDEHRIPYLEEKNYEYPPLIALQMWVASLLSWNHTTFFLANVPFNALAAFLMIFGLTLVQENKQPLMWYIFALPILLYVYLNWDITTVACLSLAMGMWARRYFYAAFFLLGLGGTGKLFPLFAVIPLLCSLYQEENKITSIFKSLVYVFMGWGLLNIPFLLLESFNSGLPKGWLNVYSFHAKRFPEFGSFWYWIAGNIGMEPISEAYKNLVDKLSLLLFFAGMICILVYQYINKNPGWNAAGAIVCLCMLLSKVYSPQYALWLIPFFAIVPTPMPLILGFYCIDLISFISIFQWFRTWGTLDESFWRELLMWAVLVRSVIFLALIFFWSLKPKNLLDQGKPNNPLDKNQARQRQVERSETSPN